MAAETASEADGKGPINLVADADCGSQKLLYLSYDAARKYKEKNHPRVTTVGFEADPIGGFQVPKLHYRRHAPCGSKTGAHPICAGSNPLRACCWRSRNDKANDVATKLASQSAALRGDFSKYGHGVVLYFKFLKLTTVLFLVMTLLAMPSLLLYWSASAGTKGAFGAGASSSASSSSKTGGMSALSSLSWFTIGNLGEASVVCASGHEKGEGSIALACPSSGMMIRSIEVAYGSPRGECSCPTSRIPGPTCPGVVTSGSGFSTARDSSPNGCDPPGSYCHLSSSRTVPVPSGASWRSGSCCSDRLVDGRPWFGDLDMTYSPLLSTSYGASGVSSLSASGYYGDLAACAADSATVNRIARGLCVGKATCRISLNPSHRQVWAPSIPAGASATDSSTSFGMGLFDTSSSIYCPPGKVQGNGLCYDWLASGGGLAGCVDDGGSPSSSSGASNSSVVVGPAGVSPQYSDYAYRYRNSTGMRMVAVAKCYETNIRMDWIGDGVTVSKSDVAIIAMLFAFAAAVIYLGAACVLSAREGQSSDTHVSAADYTIMLTSLPPHQSVAELELGLRDHFEAVLSSQPRVYCDLEGGVKLADINFGLRDTRLISLFAARGVLLRQLERTGRIELIRGASGDVDGQAKARGLVRKVLEKLRATDARIDAAQGLDAAKAGPIMSSSDDVGRAGSNRDRAKRGGNDKEQAEAPASAAIAAGSSAEDFDETGADVCLPIKFHMHRGDDSRIVPLNNAATSAFITFQEEEGALRAMATYPRTYVHWCCQPKELRYKGVHRLWVSRAPEPSDIAWSNLGFSGCARVVRRLVTLVLMVGTILTATYLIFLAEDRKRDLSRSYPDVSCDALIVSGAGTANVSTIAASVNERLSTDVINSVSGGSNVNISSAATTAASTVVHLLGSPWYTNATLPQNTSSSAAQAADGSNDPLVGDFSWWLDVVLNRDAAALTVAPSSSTSAVVQGTRTTFTKAAVVHDVYWRSVGGVTGNSGVLGCYCSQLWASQGPSALFTELFPVPTPLSPSVGVQYRNASLIRRWTSDILSHDALSLVQHNTDNSSGLSSDSSSQTTVNITIASSQLTVSLPILNLPPLFTLLRTPAPGMYAASDETYFELIGVQSEALCKDWLATFISVSLLTYGGSIITLAINVLLRTVIYTLIAWERHWNKTSELLSRALYLFLLQFVNTGVLILLLNAYISTDFSMFRGGEYEDFLPAWYGTVGVAITLTMTINIVLPHITPLLFTLFNSCARCYDRSCTCNRSRTRKLTQTELNLLQLGPELVLDERYAQAFNAIFVCMCYSIGMPLLLPILLVTMLVTYWVDKLLFALAYQTPPQFNPSLPRTFTSMLPVAAVIHLCIGAWMLSAGDVFPSLTNAADTPLIASIGSGALANGLAAIANYDPLRLQFGARLTSVQVIPLVILALLVTAVLTIDRCFWSTSRSMLRSCCSCFDSGTKNRRLPPYFLAIPPDEVQAVATGVRLVKPHLRPLFAAAHEIQSKAGTRSVLAMLVGAFEEAEGQAREARAVHAQALQDVQLMDSQIYSMLAAGVVPPSDAQLAAMAAEKRLQQARLLAKRGGRGLPHAGDDDTITLPKQALPVGVGADAILVPLQGGVDAGVVETHVETDVVSVPAGALPAGSSSARQVIAASDGDAQASTTIAVRVDDGHVRQRGHVASLSAPPAFEQAAHNHASNIGSLRRANSTNPFGVADTGDDNDALRSAHDVLPPISAAVAAARASLRRAASTQPASVRALPGHAADRNKPNSRGGKGNPFDAAAGNPFASAAGAGAAQPRPRSAAPHAEVMAVPVPAADDGIASAGGGERDRGRVRQRGGNPFESRPEDAANATTTESTPAGGSVPAVNGDAPSHFGPSPVTEDCQLELNAEIGLTSLPSVVVAAGAHDADARPRPDRDDEAVAAGDDAAGEGPYPVNGVDSEARVHCLVTDEDPVSDEAPASSADNDVKDLVDSRRSQPDGSNNEAGAEQSAMDTDAKVAAASAQATAAVLDADAGASLPAPDVSKPTAPGTAADTKPTDGQSSPKASSIVDSLPAHVRERIRGPSSLRLAPIDGSALTPAGAAVAGLDLQPRSPAPAPDRTDDAASPRSTPTNPFANGVGRTPPVDVHRQPSTSMASRQRQPPQEPFTGYDSVSTPLPEHSVFSATALSKPAPLSPSQLLLLELQGSIKRAQRVLRHAASAEATANARCEELRQRIAAIVADVGGGEQPQPTAAVDAAAADDAATAADAGGVDIELGAETSGTQRPSSNAQGQASRDRRSSYAYEFASGNGAGAAVSGSGSSSPRATGSTAATTAAESVYISGPWSYDLHDNRAYQMLFGLDTEVEDTYKRRMHAGLSGTDRRNSLLPAADGARSPDGTDGDNDDSDGLSPDAIASLMSVASMANVAEMEGRQRQRRESLMRTHHEGDDDGIRSRAGT